MGGVWGVACGLVGVECGCMGVGCGSPKRAKKALVSFCLT